MNSPDLKSSFSRSEKAFEKRFRFLRKRDQCVRFSASIVLCLVAVTGIVLGSLLWEMLFRGSSSIRFFRLGCLKAAGFAACVFSLLRLYHIFVLRRRIPDDETLALRLGHAYPKIRDRLINGLQVHWQIGRADGGTSPSMASKAFSDILQEIMPLDFRPVVSKGSLRLIFRFLGIETALALGILAVFPGDFVHAWERVFDPSRKDGREYLSPLTLLPGDTWVIQGEDVEVKVQTEVPQISRITLFFQGEGESKVWERELTPPFRYRFAGVRKDLVYRARWKKIQTPEYRIRVVERPTVRVLEMKTIPPSYTRIGAEILEQNFGQVDVLKGTRIALTIQANKPVEKASLHFKSRKVVPLKVDGPTVLGSFLAMHEDGCWIDLEDNLGLHNSDPIVYPIRVIEDRFPSVRLLLPGKDVDLDETMSLPLLIDEEDDFGIAQTKLFFRVSGNTVSVSNDTAFVSIPLPMESDQPAHSRIDFPWDLNGLDLLPEQMVQYAVEVVDNDRISGPKTARTPFFSARFPSMVEIFRDVEERQNEHIEDLVSLYEEGKDVRQELEEISEEIKTANQVSWMERKKFEDAVQKTEDIRKEIGETAEKIGEMIDTMAEKAMIKPEVARKYDELQKLFGELVSPSLRDMMQKLQESIQRISEDEIQKALDRLKNSEDTLLQSLERTIALLKRLQVEQKIEELQKRMENLFERQMSVNERIDGGPPDELAREESSIRQDMGSFREEIDKTAEKMQDLSNMPVEPMENIGLSMDRNELTKRLGNIENHLRKGQAPEAHKEGTAAGQEMTAIMEQLNRIQDMMQGQEKERISEALNDYSSRLLELSQKQEGLGESIRTNRLSKDSAMERQLSIYDGFSQVVDSMVQLSKQTFFITPEIGNAMGETRSKMQQAIAGFSISPNAGTDSPQKGAMSGLNRTVVEIQKALEKMSGSGSGLGSEEWMMQMEQLAQQQSGINRQTSDWLGRGGLSLEEQAALSRIASGQDGVRRSLEDLSGRMESVSQLASNLDKIIQDMEDVVRDLQGKDVNPRVLEKQQRILSRLLDAQRSLHKEDFDKRRESKTGIDMARRSPVWNGPPVDSEEEAVRNDVMRTFQKGYTKEFQEWIRLYFLALDKETNK